jgi:site-specific recombinase XerD
MNGRKEHEEKILKKIEKKVNESPWYMKNFYYTLVRKSYTTKEAYINRVLSFLNFIKNEFNLDVNDINIFKDIKPSMINIYIANLSNLKDGARAGKLYAVKSFFIFLTNDGYIENNPFDKVAIPKDNEEHKITYLTKDEIKVVQNNIKNSVENGITRDTKNKWDKRDYAIVMLSLSLGLRVTSVSEIDIDDIDFEKKEIKIVEKGNKTRYIYFSSNIESILKEWIMEREIILSPHLHRIRALFVSNRKERITSRSIFNIVEKYTANIDKHITPHKLRSTCATNVYNSTGDIYLTADVLGHRNIANTRRYAQISEERKKQAAQAMDDILF